MINKLSMHLLLLLALLASAGAQESKPCVFCEIIAGAKQQEGIVYRDAQVIAFLSIGPRNPGHVLVVPVVHADDFLVTPPATMHAMTDLAQRLAVALPRAGLKAEGFQVQINTGKAAGQSVFHAHLHVIPRYAGEPPPKVPEDKVPLAQLAPIAAKIRAALAAMPATAPLAGPRPPMVLPKLGEVVPLDRIRIICAYYGLETLWQKIERDPPALPFKSDGCTGWFDDWRGVSFYPAGFLHDLKYWAGYPGEDVERLAADAELMTDVARLLGSTEMAEAMFHGVRVGGNERFKASFSWGFGRAKPGK